MMLAHKKQIKTTNKNLIKQRNTKENTNQQKRN